MDNDLIKLSEQIKNKLSGTKLSLSCAESCTGGMFGAVITEISGSSEYFSNGLITYSNEAKVKLLGVKPETLKEYGAVSEQTAIEMLNGLNTDIGISITGVAGPSHSEEKPVGLVYIAIKFKEKTECTKNNFTGNRNQIRTQSVKTALNMILKSTEFLD